MSDTKTEIEKEPKNNSNHIAGCGIFLVILAMVIFLISVTVYSYFDHKNAFNSITQESSVPTDLAPLSDAEAVEALDRKFSDFGRLVKNEKFASMSLSLSELNLAVASFDKLAEFKNTFFVTAITDEHIEARSSFKVNVGFDGIRHFNGLLKLKPVIAQGSIFPIIENAIPDTGADVPPKILQAIPVLMFVEYRNDESIQDVFHKLTKVELNNGALFIESDPANTEASIMDTDVSADVSIGFQLFGLLTFIFVTTLAFALWFTKFKKKTKATE